MVFLFKEEGGLRTEDGLFNEAFGVFSISDPSCKKESTENFFLWDSGVLISGILIPLGEQSLFKTSSEGPQLGKEFVRSVEPSSMKSFLHSMFGIAVILLRMEQGDFSLE